MGLYRNIAGFLDNRQVGLSFFDMPTVTLDISNLDTTNSLLPSPFSDPEAYQEQKDDFSTAYETEMRGRYDYLLTTSLPTLTTAGYYVENNGSIFQWNDAGHTTSSAYLGLDWLQKIENERGTPGALLLHMQQPDLAKDTAGYQGGTSGTWYQDNGVDPATQVVADPIPAVQTLPPVQTNTPVIPTPLPTPTTPTPTTPAVPMATAVTNNFLPLAVIAGLGVVAVAGDQLLHQRRKVVFAGGLAALFYLMAKRT
jgi:hypothetical protein